MKKEKNSIARKIIAIIFIGCFIVAIKDYIKEGNLSSGSSGSEVFSSKKEITYQPVDVRSLAYELKNNAAKAQNEYKGKYIEISGNIDHIDSDGDSFTVNDGEFISKIHCRIHNTKHTQIIINKSVGSPVKVKGQIKRVGNVLGYSIDVIELE